MDKNKIATGVGFTGGGVFFILNLATKGEVPGGAEGGVLGFIIGYALAWLVLAFIPSNRKEPTKIEDSTSTWDCPKCNLANENTTYKCIGCGYSLL